MPQELYQRLETAKARVGKKLVDVQAETAFTEIDKKQIQDRVNFIEELTGFGGQVVNLVKAEKRIKEKETEAETAAYKRGWSKELVKEGGLFEERGLHDVYGYKDPLTGEVHTQEFVSELVESEKSMKAMGVEFGQWQLDYENTLAGMEKSKIQRDAMNFVKGEVGGQWDDLRSMLSSDLGNQYKTTDGKIDWGSVQKNFTEIMENLPGEKDYHGDTSIDPTDEKFLIDPEIHDTSDTDKIIDEFIGLDFTPDEGEVSFDAEDVAKRWEEGFKEGEEMMPLLKLNPIVIK